MHKKWLKIFLVSYILIMATIGIIVYMVDPYLHYHKPYFGLTPAYDSAMIQVSLNPGLVEQYDYDAVLVGASIVEPLDGHEIERLFLNDEQTVIKVPYSGATAKNHEITLEKAFKKQDVGTVIYGLDTFSYNKTDYEDTYSELPMWLYDNNPLNDCYYMYSLETLVTAIPDMFKMEKVKEEDLLSDAYALQWKNIEFSKETVLSTYKIYTPKDMGDKDIYLGYAKKQFENNLKPLIEANPGTRFIFICLPYSILYWDTSYMRGEYEGELAVKEYLLSELLKYPNIEIYDFQTVEEIVMNLDNYKDRIHYSPAVGQLVLEKVAAGENRVTYENMNNSIEGIRNLYKKLLASYDEFMLME